MSFIDKFDVYLAEYPESSVLLDVFSAGRNQFFAPIDMRRLKTSTRIFALSLWT